MRAGVIQNSNESPVPCCNITQDENEQFQQDFRGKKS
jgi:hypothetical protein